MKIGFLVLLGLIFITLKLTNVIAWSWWYVLMPLYIFPVIYLGILAVAAIGVVILALSESAVRKRKRGQK